MNLGMETEFIEFKESTGEKHEVLESIVAIINKHGKGTLYFGVKDNGDVKGQVITDSTIKDVSESIFRDIEPRIIPTIEKIDLDGKQVLKVTFSGTQAPYSAYGKFVIRVGTQNRKMTRDELVKLIKEHDYSLEWEKDQSNSVDDINDDTLQKFYRESVDCGRLAMEEYDKESLLSVLGLVKDDKILRAGYVLFGNGTPISLKLACYASNEKLTFLDLKEIKGNIYNLIGEALMYVSKNLNWRVEIGEEKRIEIPEIPIRAVREMVINAFAHADYTHNPEIEIDIHPGKITIFNPGSFPDGLTPNDFIDRNISSIKRNPIILSTLFRCKDVEQSGTGFRRMNQLCQEANVKWTFENTAYGFCFSFIRENVHADVRANVLAKTVGCVLTENEKIIYFKIKENCKVQKANLAMAIGKSEKTVQRILASLENKGYIKRIGTNQYGYWEVIK